MSKKFFAIVLPLLFLGCKENAPPEPPPYVRSIELEALDASCTEVWLKITLTQTTTDSILLTRDGQSVQTLRLTTADSILIDEGLLPNRSYLYKVYRLSGASVTDSSEAVQVTTMDTTSHNFTFQIDTLGVTSSVLYDVAIISDSNIWAVGELFLNKPNGQLDPILYNAAHWDGRRWNIIRIPYIYQGSPFYGSIKCLFAFNANDIWFSNSVRWDGQQFQNVDLANSIFYGVAINKMWGSPSGELYVVGNNGTIAYSPDRGTSWRRLESGTSVDLKDIWGRSDGSTLWACGYKFDNSKSILLEYDNGSWQTLWFREGATPVPPFDFRVTSLWYKKRLYLCNTSHVFTMKNGVATQISPSFDWLIRRIRGNDENDIAVVTEEGAIWHYNGKSWKKIFSDQQKLFASVTMKGNVVVAVGTDYSTFPNKAVVVVGKR